MERCYNCMNEITEGKKCSKCGFVNTEYVPSHRLKPGTMLSGRYYLGNAIGEGGFGITYIGFDTRLEMKVAVKEFFPSGFVTRYIKNSATVEVSNSKNNDFFKSGKDQFLREARMIARFSNDSGIVDVRDFFEENGTAYIVMEYIEGKNLKVYMREHGLFKVDAILTLIRPILDALEKVHNVGLIHRDISPDNIMFTKDSKLKLMNFGAAKNTDSEMTARGSIILKPGYAPPEQYKRDGKQGAWTDIYALCATLYKCITGVTPDESTLREKEDKLKRISEYGVNIDPNIEQTIMDGLNPEISKRIQSVSELKDILYTNLNLSQQDTEDSTTVLYVDDNAETMVIDENYAQLENLDDTVNDNVQDETELLTHREEKVSTEQDRQDLSVPSEKKLQKNNKTKLFVLIGIVAVLLIGGIVSVVLLTGKPTSDKQNITNDNSSNTIEKNTNQEKDSELDETKYVTEDDGHNNASNSYSGNESNNSKNNQQIEKTTISETVLERTEVQSEVEPELPDVSITSVTGDLFEVNGVNIDDDSYEETDSDTYHISFDMKYLVEYDYHSEELLNSNGLVTDCMAYSETDVYVRKDIEMGDYVYKISVFSSDGNEHSGEIHFSII